MTDDADVRILEFPGRQLRLELVAPDEVETQLALARLAIDAVLCFADGLCEPLSVDLWLGCCDPVADYPLSDPEPALPYWLLQREHLPRGVDVRPAWESEEIAKARELTRETITSWVQTALANAACGSESNAHACWRELAFRAFRLRLPDGLRVPPDGLRLKQGAGETIHPVEWRDGGSYVSGPMPPRTRRSPLELAVSNEAGLVTLDVALFWSILTEPGAAGHAAVQRSIDRLRVQGWTRVP
jgi:hypothetical protein